MGGEKASGDTGMNLDMGSPPRGRGKGNQAFSWYGSSRITPAWAGKRFWNRPWVWATSDHPRMGGEKSFDQACTGVVEGSPPHGRGKDVRQVGAVCGRGITPAWAGKRIRSKSGGSNWRDHPRVGGEKLSCLVHGHHHMGSPPRGRGKAGFRLMQANGFGITPAWAGKRLKRSHRSGIFISGPIPFHSVLHRPAGSGGSRAGRDGSPAGQPQNTGPA